MTGRIAAGARWAFLSGAVARLTPPLYTIVLARILSPADFGLVAVSMVVIAFVGLFQNLGFKQALVQSREPAPPLMAAVFWAGLGLGVTWFTLVYLTAPLAADLYRNPEVVPVLRALGALFLITPLAAVPEALLLRELDFRRLFAVEVLPAVVPGVVAIGLGLAGFGVWALVCGTLTGAVLQTGGLWILVSYRPGRPPGRGPWRTLFRFGGWVSLEALLSWIVTYVDQAFAGRYLTAAQVGFYRMGFSLALLPATGVTQVLARVLFPAFSRVQDDRAQVREGFEKTVRLVALVAVPLGAGLVAFADPVIPLLLGARWAPTTRIVELLGIVGVLSAVVNVAPPLYRATGRVDIMPKFFLARAAFSVPAYWFAAQHGPVALAAAHLALAACFVPVNLGIACLVFNASVRSVLGAVGMPLLYAGGALAIAHGLALAVPAGDSPLGVGVEMLAFVLAYGGLFRLVSNERYAEFRQVLRGLLRASP